MTTEASPASVRNAMKACLVLGLTIAMALPLAAKGRGGMYYDKPAGIDLRAQAYKDGVYAGVANGFRPGLEVEVTVKGGKVAGVAVIGHNEVDRRFYALPISAIPAAIVKKQSTKVDAVSGASATSYGIMAAVENALKAAM